MPREKVVQMTAAVRRAYELEALKNELSHAQELIAELRDENRQLREFLNQDKMESRAKQALASRRTWRCH